MNAAIYARKSNEDQNVDEAKSITRQMDAARAFIATKEDWRASLSALT